jgi:protein gp37
MASKVEWTEETWSPVTGCDKASDGCQNCYAERITKRFPATFPRGFEVHVRPERIPGKLAKWRKPRIVFVCSMSDLFHKKVSDAFVLQVFETMLKYDQHTYQVLTKRSSRMRNFVRQKFPDWALRPPPHIWLGTTVEDAKRAKRIDHLRETPAAVRFLSVEPLIADPGELNLAGIDWVIIGGESGPGARPMELRWVRDVIRQARDAGAAVFVKQLGRVWAKGKGKGGKPEKWPADLRVREFPR